MTRFVLASLAALLLTACGSVAVTDYSDVTPRISLEEFFSGPLTAHGVVKNRSGKVIRHFNASIDASWEDGVGTLVEDFEFNDGELQQRIWVLKPAGKQQYIGTAGDVVGEGQLQLAGNSVFLEYVLRIPYRDGSIDVTVDDRMYLVADDVLINESTLKKFGVRVGELLLVIKRAPADP